MDGLAEQIDIYCERTDFSFWAEPVNALTNAAFLVAALIMWRRSRGLPLGRVLCVILAAIGTGSFLYHTFATQWAALSDVIPIGLFILVYLFAVNWHFLGWPLWASILGVIGFIPYAIAATWIFDRLPFFEVSNFYWTVPLLLVVYCVLFSRQLGETARGMLIGAAILCGSISIRSVDMALCPNFPLGTHFLWHCLNGVMLGWMIEVYRRNRLKSAPRT
ncbi:MAG: ceramidase domain-containing protein [Pseudomonadota bacterium]